MRPQQRLARGLVVAGLQIAIFISAFLPWRWSVRLGSFTGVTAYLFLSRERQKTLRHLQLALGNRLSPGKLRRTARACFAHLGTGFFELLCLSRLTPDALNRIVEIQGEENLQKALGQGRGVIYIGGHIGNWELMAAAMAQKGYPIKVVAAPIYDPRLNRLMVQYRARFGVETIQRGSAQAARQILAGPRKGDILAFLIDQDTEVEGIHVDFFGRKAHTPTGAASLAIHTGAPVLMGYTHRLDNGRHRIVIHEPLTVLRTGQREQDIRVNTAVFKKHLEDFILRRPEQWVWMHRRWGKSVG